MCGICFLFHYIVLSNQNWPFAMAYCILSIQASFTIWIDDDDLTVAKQSIWFRIQIYEMDALIVHNHNNHSQRLTGCSQRETECISLFFNSNSRFMCELFQFPFLFLLKPLLFHTFLISYFCFDVGLCLINSKNLVIIWMFDFDGKCANRNGINLIHPSLYLFAMLNTSKFFSRI